MPWGAVCRESPAGDRGHSSGDRLWKAVGGPAFGLCPFEDTWEGVVAPQTLAFFCRWQIRNQRVSGRTTRSGGCGRDSAVPALHPVLLRSPAVSAVPEGACDCSPRCPPGHRGAPSLPAGELPWPRVAPGPANRPFTEPRHFHVAPGAALRSASFAKEKDPNLPASPSLQSSEAGHSRPC